MTEAEPREPGWYDDPDGRRRWWSGQHWGAYAPWGDQGTTPRPAAPTARPALDPSLTFDPTAAGRAARALPASERAAIPRQPARPQSAQPTSAGRARHGNRMQVAYVLFATLGLLGAHRFYLGRVRSATVQMLLSFAAAGAAVVLVGDPAALVLAAVPIAAAGWWLMDLFRTAAMVRARDAGDTNLSDAPGYDRGWPPA